MARDLSQLIEPDDVELRRREEDQRAGDAHYRRNQQERHRRRTRVKRQRKAQKQHAEKKGWKP